MGGAVWLRYVLREGDIITVCGHRQTKKDILRETARSYGIQSDRNKLRPVD